MSAFEKKLKRFQSIQHCFSVSDRLSADTIRQISVSEVTKVARSVASFSGIMIQVREYAEASAATSADKCAEVKIRMTSYN